MQSPVQTIAAWYETLDPQRFVAQEVHFEVAPGFPEAGLYRTREEVAAMFKRLFSRFSRWKLRVDDVVEQGDRVFATGAYLGATPGGRTFETPFCHVWTVREGQIARVLHIPNTHTMQQAFAEETGFDLVSTERANLAQVRASFDLFVNKRRTDLTEQFFDPAFEMPALGLHGYEGVAAFTERFWTPFPDLHDEIKAICAAGDTVTTWLVASGTHQGPWRGIAPTGRQVSWNGVAIDRLRNGRIFHRDLVIDWEPVVNALAGRELESEHA
jgi:predicted ester cyclase